MDRPNISIDGDGRLRGDSRSALEYLHNPAHFTTFVEFGMAAVLLKMQERIDELEERVKAAGI